MTTVLEIDDLVVSYGQIVAVRGASLRVEQGEIVALLGPNGAGKSSTLGAVAGLVPAASGRVVLSGQEIQRLAPEQIVRRGVALCPEGRRVFAGLSVADNLRLGSIPQPSRRAAEAALGRVLDTFPDLASRTEQDAGTLSGGQQQMLAIARALMSGPSLLLLDEPSLGLAPILAEEVFQLVLRLRDGGVTVLLVEQTVHRALEIADRAYVLAHGSVEREGPTESLRAAEDIEQTYLGIGVG